MNFTVLGEPRPGGSKRAFVNPITEKAQADFLTSAYKFASADPYVTLAFWYSLRNNWWSHDADDWESRTGLLRTDWTAKPAYAAMGAA